MMRSTDYHDYVFKDGKFIGEFEEMYKYSSQTPWRQDKNAFAEFSKCRNKHNLRFMKVDFSSGNPLASDTFYLVVIKEIFWYICRSLNDFLRATFTQEGPFCQWLGRKKQ